MHIIMRCRRTLVGQVLFHFQASQQRFNHGERQFDLIRNVTTLGLADMEQKSIDDGFE